VLIALAKNGLPATMIPMLIMDAGEPVTISGMLKKQSRCIIYFLDIIHISKHCNNLINSKGCQCG